LVAIFYLAWFLEIPRRAPRGPGVNHLTQNARTGARCDPVARRGLVVVEPDMGTACMISLIALRDAVRLRPFLCATSLPQDSWPPYRSIYLLIVRVPYRLERVRTFFSPGTDPQGPRLPAAAIAYRGRLGRV
jgi:cell division protein FtsW (lipid II flippase)